MLKKLLVLASICLITSNANSGLITVSGSGLTGTDRFEDLNSGGLLGENLNFAYSSGLTVASTSGRGASLVNNSNCSNGQDGNYIYIGVSSNSTGGCGGSSNSLEGVTLSFDQTVSELSWFGFNRASSFGYTIEALMDTSVVSSIIFDFTNRFEQQYVNFSGSNFNSIRITEGSSNSTWFSMDNFAWNIASSEVPEPSIIALFGLGLLGLGFSRRKVRS